jgi:hypothetical protein
MTLIPMPAQLAKREFGFMIFESAMTDRRCVGAEGLSSMTDAEGTCGASTDAIGAFVFLGRPRRGGLAAAVDVGESLGALDWLKRPVHPSSCCNAASGAILGTKCGLTVKDSMIYAALERVAGLREV